jgi:Cof subfamily protein (haloacid dehalogenase superfamily)
MPNLFFCDIDGTLIKSDGTISDTLRNALHDLSAAGHGLILTSGRPLAGMMNVYNYLDTPFTYSYMIANNGCLIYDCNKKQPIYENKLSITLVDQIQALAEEMHVYVQTYTDTSTICREKTEELRMYMVHVKMPVICCARFSEVLESPPYKMLSLSTDGSEPLLPFKAELEKRFGSEIQTMFSGSGYLEIIPKNADKGKALQYLCQYTGIPLENSYAAGDSENDIPMITAAGKGYAMKNAQEPVKQKARYITREDHEHDGILEIIQNMLS